MRAQSTEAWRARWAHDLEGMTPYEYPNDLDLHPNSELHQTLIAMLNDITQLGYRTVDTIASEWDDMDWVLDGYQPMDEADRRAKENDSRKPVTIVIPMTAAMREIYLTYMQNAFVRPEGMHWYRGMGGPERTVRAALMERVIARQTQWFKEARAFDIIASNGFSYGPGLAHTRWSKKMGPTIVDEQVDDLLAAVIEDLGMDFQTGDIIRMVEQEQVLAEGTEVVPIDPRQLLLDPNYSIDDIQTAQFVGWTYRTDTGTILSQERDEEYRMFNGRAVKMLWSHGKARSRWYRQDSARDRRAGTDGLEEAQDDDTLTSAVDVTQLYVRLIPSDWGLGDKDLPELWQFAIASDEIIIQAQPLKLLHGEFPIVACAPNARGHQILPISHLMLTLGQQMSVDWHARSRNQEVMSNVNGRYIVDPTKIEYKDFRDGDGPMVVRMKPGAFGEGRIDQAYHQIQVNDVTARHWDDIGKIMNLAREGNGTVDITMGSLNGMPERPTARGMDIASTNAMSRLARLAKIIDEQFMLPLGRQMAWNTIQFMSEDVVVDIIGRHEADLRQFYGIGGASVSPLDLDPAFEVVPYSNAFPQARDTTAMAEVMKTFLGVEGVGQVLMSEYRIAELFGAWMKAEGFEDVNEFRIKNGEGGMPMNVQVMPDEMVAQQAQAGNMMPMGVPAGAM